MASQRDPSTNCFQHLHFRLANHVSRMYACADDPAIMHADGDWQALGGVISKTWRR